MDTGEGQATTSSSQGRAESQVGRAETRFPLLMLPQDTGQREVGGQEGGWPPEGIQAPGTAGRCGAQLGGRAHCRTQGFSDGN